MAEDIIHFEIPQVAPSIIKVIGVGGGGNNAVNHMYSTGIKDVTFAICNTDSQALINSPVPEKIKLGQSLTEGRGAGNKPDIGRQAAIENLQDIVDSISKDTKMVFITCGMGGGTGTGAAPVIAKAAKELGILTVAIVTLPFRFEGKLRFEQAVEGINEISNYVDSLLIINNEKLREIYGDLRISEAFAKADNVLATAAKGIAEIITVHGYINVDFADVQTVMTKSGVSVMGSAIAEGENRALEAIQEALTSPLLNNNDITGAKSILLNITSGSEEITMDEVGIITDYVQREVAKDSLMIWGTGFDESLGNKISVTIVATGFDKSSIPELLPMFKKTPERIPLAEPDKMEGIRFTGTKPQPTQSNINFELEGSEYGGFEDEGMGDSDFQVHTRRLTDDNHEIMVTQTRPLKSRKELGHNIEEIENVPAYIRQGLDLKTNDVSKSNGASRMSLTEDENDVLRLRTDNSYLHDNVD
jgi:cell division protein FtsZ